MAYNKSQKLQDNIAAIKLVLQLSKEGRTANDDERAVLRRYSGFGGLKFILNPAASDDDKRHWKVSDQPYFRSVRELYSVIHEYAADEKEERAIIDSIKRSVNTAFYTPGAVIDAIASVFKEHGVMVRAMLDPSAGIGKFGDSFKQAYDGNIDVTSFEKDLLTGKILSALNPNDNVFIDGFETIPAKVQGTFDLATSNIPFGDIRVMDNEYRKSKNDARRYSVSTIHNYFFLKALDQVREGGFVAFITSRGFMDSPSNNLIRQEIARNARLVGAFRLPDGMFRDEAGTEVGSDLIVLQKVSGYDMSLDPETTAFCETSKGFLDISGEDFTDITMNTYWWQSMMASDAEVSVSTSMKRGTDPYGKPTLVFTHDGGMEGITKQLKEYFSRELHREYVEYYQEYAPKIETVVVEQNQPLDEAAIIKKGLEERLFYYNNFLKYAGISDDAVRAMIVVPKDYSSEGLVEMSRGIIQQLVDKSIENNPVLYRDIQREGWINDFGADVVHYAQELLSNTINHVDDKIDAKIIELNTLIDEYNNIFPVGSMYFDERHVKSFSYFHPEGTSVFSRLVKTDNREGYGNTRFKEMRAEELLKLINSISKDYAADIKAIKENVSVRARLLEQNGIDFDAYHIKALDIKGVSVFNVNEEGVIVGNKTHSEVYSFESFKNGYHLEELSKELESLKYSHDENFLKSKFPKSYEKNNPYIVEWINRYYNDTVPSADYDWNGAHKEAITALSRERLLDEVIVPLFSSLNQQQEKPKAEQQPQSRPQGQSRRKVRHSAQSAPVQLSLFSMWDDMDAGLGPSQEEVQAQETERAAQAAARREAERKRMVPRAWAGDKKEWYRDGVIVVEPDTNTVGLLNGDIFSPVDNLTVDQSGRLRQYVLIRDTYHELYNTEAELREEQAGLREELNRHYDNFFLQYGHLNERKNTRLIMMDVLGRDSLALENGEGRDFVKADIFERPVSFISYEITHVDTPEEALNASLNRYGSVNFEYMASLTDHKSEEMPELLKGQIYYMPDGRYEIASKVLSGNIYEKLDYVREALDMIKGQEPGDDIDASIIAALEDTKTALEAVLPEQIAFDDIGLQFGERWIPTEYYEEYVGKIFDTKMEIHYAEHVDEYSLKAEDRWNLKIREEFCIRGEYKDYDGMALLAHAFHNTTPDIQKCIGYDDNGDDLKGPDMEKIQLANTKIDEIRDGFTEYLTNLPKEKRDELQEMYNRKFNCFVKAKYDGSYQTFPGIDLKALASPKFNIKNIYKSQKDCVKMILENGGGVCDHEVGTGKSLIMCMAAHEMHRLGIANKPMILAMKANVAEIAATYQAAFPDDKILYAAEKDFTPANRVQFFNRIKNNDFACVIMSHDQFGKIPQAMEVQEQILRDEIRDIEEALDVIRQQGGRISGRMLTGLEKRKENMYVKLLELQSDMQNRKDDFVDFGRMGIDHIFIDESHQFKNLMFTTRHQRVSGLGNPSGSQKALNLLYAIRTIQNRTGKDLGATFLSGTTISNSLTELYLLFKYLRPQAMAKQGIHSFDAWAAVYAKKKSDFEFSVTNAVVQKERFRYFVKVPELATFYNEITDYRTGEDVGLDRPKMNVILYDIDPTEDQKDFNERLVKFAQTGDGELIFRAPLNDREMKGKMLIATDASRKASMDMRLISSELFGDDPNNKASHCARLVAEYYKKFDEQKGTQFIFSDLSTYKSNEWNIFQEIKDKLVKDYDIPAEEVRFIQEASSNKVKQKMIDLMNEGKIRVLFGSTSTLGTGVNAQQRAVAVHHIDIPWRPSDLEQRNGRARRTGNWVAKEFADNKVDVIIYAVKRTLDSYKFNLLQNKQLFITQLKTNQLGTRVIDEGAMDEENGMNFAEYVAILSGNDDLLQKAKLEKKIMALESERKTYMQARRDTEWRLGNAREKLDKNEVIIKGMTEDYERYQSQVKKGEDGSPLPGLVMNNISEFTADGAYNVDEMGAALQDAGRTVGNKDRQMGTVYGFPLMVDSIYMYDGNLRQEAYVGNKFYVKGNYLYEHNNGKLAMSKDNRLGAVRYGVNALEKISGYIEQYLERNKKFRADIAEYERIAGKPWGKEEELKGLKKELEALDTKIRESLDETTKNMPKEEVKPYKFSKEGKYHKVTFVRDAYPFVSISEMREFADTGNWRNRGFVRCGQWDGDVMVSEPEVVGDFSLRQKAEDFISKVEATNKERKENLDWLIAKAKEDTKGDKVIQENEVIFACRDYLNQQGVDWQNVQELPKSAVPTQDEIETERLLALANTKDAHFNADNTDMFVSARRLLTDRGVDWRTGLSLSEVGKYVRKWSEAGEKQLSLYAQGVITRGKVFHPGDAAVLTAQELQLLDNAVASAKNIFRNEGDRRDAYERLMVLVDYLGEQMMERGEQADIQQATDEALLPGAEFYQQYINEHFEGHSESAIIKLSNALVQITDEYTKMPDWYQRESILAQIRVQANRNLRANGFGGAKDIVELMMNHVMPQDQQRDLAKMRVYSAGQYGGTVMGEELRTIAHQVKEYGTDSSVRAVVDKMIGIFNNISEEDLKKMILIPMPGASGYPGYMEKIVNELGERTGLQTANSLFSTEHEPLYDLKKNGTAYEQLPDIKFEMDGTLPAGTIVVLVDNVLDTGKTLSQAAKADFGEGVEVRAAVLAHTNNYQEHNPQMEVRTILQLREEMSVLRNQRKAEREAGYEAAIAALEVSQQGVDAAAVEEMKRLLTISWKSPFGGKDAKEQLNALGVDWKTGETIVANAADRVSFQYVPKNYVSTISDAEKSMMSQVASDLMTGNHLLGRRRPDGYRELMAEIGVAFAAVKTLSVTSRQRDLLVALSGQYHEGIAELVSQSGVSEDVFTEALHRVDAERPAVVQDVAVQPCQIYHEGDTFVVDYHHGFGLADNLVQQVAGVHDGQTFERAGRTMVLFDNERSMRGFIDNIRTLNITYTNNLRDAMIERLRGAGIQVNDNIEEGRFVLESFSKKSAVSERNGEVAGNSSSDSLLSSRKDHLSRHPLPNSKDGANLQKNTEIAKIKLKKIKNSGGILIKDGNAAGIVRGVSRSIGLQKSLSSQSFYNDYYLGGDREGETVRFRVSTHPASGDRFGKAGTDERISIVVYKDGEHNPNKEILNPYSEWIYDPSKMNKDEIAKRIINGFDNLLQYGEYRDDSIEPNIYHSNVFRYKDHRVYGFVDRSTGTFYVDLNIARADWPLHEYTHLWAAVMRQQNQKEWANIVQMMKDTPDIWNYVKEQYPDLHTDDEIADECLAYFSGQRGFERLTKFVDGKNDSESILDKVSAFLGKFWKAVADLLHIHFTTKEDVADFILNDFLNERNPLDYLRGEKLQDTMGLGFQFIGEKGASNIDVALDGGMYISNLRHAEKLEKVGRSPLDIKIETGWERGADGKWRLELPSFSDFDANANIEWLQRHPDTARYLELLRKENSYLFGGFAPLTDEERVEKARLQELPDNKYWKPDNIQKNPDRLTLQDYVSSPLLFMAYPELKDLAVRVEDMNNRGAYATRKNIIDGSDVHYIRLNKDMVEAARGFDVIRSRQMESTLAHEVQHYIQEQEGFARGNDVRRINGASDFELSVSAWDGFVQQEVGQEPTYEHLMKVLKSEQYSDWRQKFGPDYQEMMQTLVRMSDNMDTVSFMKNYVYFRDNGMKGEAWTQYWNTMGEVESRNVQARMGMTVEQRRHTLAVDTEDVPRDRQTANYTSVIAASRELPADSSAIDIRSEVFTKTFGDWQKAQALQHLNIDAMQDLFDAMKNALPRISRDARDVYDDFAFDMGEKYGFDWLEKLTDEERVEEHNLLEHRDKYDIEENDVNELAFELLSDQYPKEVMQLVSHSNGKLYALEDPEELEVSKVVNQDGSPKLVYHGTGSFGFDAFKASEDWNFDLDRVTKQGIFFTSDLDNAKGYMDREIAEEAGNKNPRDGVYAAYLDIKNPLVVDYDGAWWNGRRFTYEVRGEDDKAIVTFDEHYQAVDYISSHRDENDKMIIVPVAVGSNVKEIGKYVSEAIEKGNDGLILRNIRDSHIDNHFVNPADTYVVFEPKQVMIDQRIDMSKTEQEVVKVEPRKFTVQDREAGGALVDHLQAMGITVHTDIRENRRVLKAAQKDQSEVGKVRHFKTETGESYGFAYKGEIHLDLRRIDAELPLHEFAHLFCQAMQRINPDNWNHVVELLKQDAETWSTVKNVYPELTSDNDVAEEVIAQYSGKRGAEKLQAELERMTPKDDNYNSRWNNIFQNISKAVQDFWKHIGDSMNISYSSKEDIADQILNDFAKGVNPMKKMERWLEERDKEYAAAVEVATRSGNADDWSKAHAIFVSALQENVGNGVTPIMAVDGYRGKLDRLARDIKNINNTEAIKKAVDLMAPRIPANAVLVPAPSHLGYATDTLVLARALSERTDVPVADILKSDPRERQYDVKKATGHPLTAEQLGIRKEGELPEGKMPFIIDNVVNSGNTAEACVKALGHGIVYSLASATSQERHAATLKSAETAVYDKQGQLIPLSERFELKNKWLGRVMNYKPLDGDEQPVVKEPDVIQGLEGYSVDDVKSYVENGIDEILEDAGLSDDITIKKITVVGSRSRGEAHEGSDLDILVEYDGDFREDALFNILHEEGLDLEGITIDINPINPRYTLNTEEWLARDSRWREEYRQKAAVKNNENNNVELKNNRSMETSETKSKLVYQEYSNQKTNHPNELLLFQQNGIVEAFGSDAERLSNAFNLPLYNRNVGDSESLFAFMNSSEYVVKADGADLDIYLYRPKVQENLLDFVHDVKLVEKNQQQNVNIDERLEKTSNLVKELGLEYVPFSVRLPIVVPADSETDWRDKSKVFSDVMCNGDSITVYENHQDGFDDKNGIDFIDLPKDLQKFVLDQIEEKLSDVNSEMTVFVQTAHIPEFAISALVNGDFSGIDNPEDEKNIREFSSRYPNHTFAVRDDSPSFTVTSAFGKDATCVNVDIFRYATPKQLRQEQVDKQIEKLQGSYNDFVNQHGEQPLYAEVTVRFKDSKEQETVIVKLNSEIDPATDDKIFYNADSFDNLKDLMKVDNGEDFDIVNITDTQFYDKSLYQSQEERPYHITYGDDPTGVIEGDIHVHFTKELAYVSFDDFKQYAENHGGSARVMNDERWADFHHQDDAEKFANAVVDVNVSRMEEAREGVKQQPVTGENSEQEQSSGEQKKKSKWDNIDYSKYTLPEGADVKNMRWKFIKPKEGEQYGKYHIMADFQGKHYEREMYGNDIKAFFEKDEVGQRTNRVTLDQLVAKYFGKQFAEAMSIGSVQEAEHVLAEQKDAKEQVSNDKNEKAQQKAAEDKKAAEETSKKKAEEEHKSEKKEKIPAISLQSSLLVGALLAAKKNDGIWLNKDGKSVPVLHQSGAPVVSAFNSLMMALHSDANGYKSNEYTTFNAAKGDGYYVKGGENGLPFNWYKWDKYVNRFNSNEIIDKSAYDALAPEEKELYKVQRIKEERSIFNIDQTTMPEVKKEDYDAILQSQDKESVYRGVTDAKDSAPDMLKQFLDLKAKHPDALLLFRCGDFYEIYKDDAEKASNILGITLTKSIKTKDEQGAPLSMAGFPHHALDTYLPKLIRAGERVAICDQIGTTNDANRRVAANNIYAKAEPLVSALLKQENVVNLPFFDTGYDVKDDMLRLSDRRQLPLGKEVSTALAYVNDSFRAAAAYTGADSRLNRVSSNSMLPGDVEKYDRLVSELAAGVMMSREGLPATLSNESMLLIPYWERELKESPSLMMTIERDVNNAVEVLEKIKSGETVDYGAIRGEKAFDAVRPKLYTIANDLATIPDAVTKQVVVVKDQKNKSAAVILPAGASLEVNNEITGLNKNRFLIALRKQGFENIQFFNAGGALGLNQSNDFFADKIVEVAKLKQYELNVVQNIDLTEEIERSLKVDLKQVQVTFDDNMHPVLFVKPVEGDSFTVYPEASDVKLFFDNVRSPEFDTIRENLGQKYYGLVSRHPDLKVDILMPKVSSDIDLNRISKVNITKDKYKPDTTIIFATIDGQQQKPIELNKIEAQRYWLVDDKNLYKMLVAAQKFEEKLSLDNGQSEDGQGQFLDGHEGSGVGGSSSSAEASAEEQEEKQERKGGYHL